MLGKDEKTQANKNTKSGLIEIKNLIVSSAPLRKVALGTVEGIVDITKRNEGNVNAIIWNEKGLTLLLAESNTEIAFIPEFHPSTEMLFHREEKRERLDFFGDSDGIRVWEGEYEPIQFTKSNLIKFLQKYSLYFDEDVTKAIKNLRVTQKRTTDSEMLSLDDDDNVRSTEEKTQTTNLPRQFNAKMPLFDGFEAELEFEAKVVKKKDRYGEEKSQQVIEMRCTNGREAIREVMYAVLEQFPEKIPRYYGAMKIRRSK